jgi:apolipoprotein D and lipocalin family protein
MRQFIVGALSLLLGGCLGTPRGVQPVKRFNLQRYLGRWYEIARLDHSFERGLSNVSASYSMREDGGVRVVNRGFDDAKSKWKQAVGKAFFVRGPQEGYLKVSFFGPFYGSYVIFELDREDYQYAYVSGSSTSYLWFLSRTPVVDPGAVDRFKERARGLGFDLDQLILVKQDRRGQGGGTSISSDVHSRSSMVSVK